MILASHGLIASQIASFDADAVAFFGRVTTAGGSLSATEKAAVNQLVLDLKANSLWTPMKAIYPMVGASAAACAQNLKSSSFTGTFSSGWTFASTGATPNGTSAYMDTGLNANSTNTNIDSTHGATYIRNNISSSAVMGVKTALLQRFFELYPNISNTAYISITDGTTYITGTNTDSRGFYIGRRNNSSSINLWKNNGQLFSGSLTSQNIYGNYSYYIGAINDVGTASAFSSYQIAFSSIGDGLTDTQASNFYTAVQAFQTTLSRQV